MSKSSVIRLLALATVVAVILVGLTWATAESTGKSFNDTAKTVQALGTLAAIIAGGVFALYKLQVFRDFQPHLTITHEVSHRRIGESYVHLDVVTTLRNNAKINVVIREASFVLSMISPTTDEEIDALYAEAFNASGVVEDEAYARFQWTVLEDITIERRPGEFIVEPSESYRETREFIVSDDVQTVMVYTYFYNSEYTESSSSAEGWRATTIYDIIESD